MKDVQTARHDLKRDIHNILNLLKFIYSEEEIKDPEIKSMLELAIEREEQVVESLHVAFGKGE
ncbi:MAG: hypothetical protein ACLGHN_11695 [Bacteriovoracia bacterium]